MPWTDILHQSQWCCIARAAATNTSMRLSPKTDGLTRPIALTNVRVAEIFGDLQMFQPPACGRGTREDPSIRGHREERQTTSLRRQGWTVGTDAHCSFRAHLDRTDRSL